MVIPETSALLWMQKSIIYPFSAKLIVIQALQAIKVLSHLLMQIQMKQSTQAMHR